MGLLKTIWFLLTGIDKQTKKIDEKIDLLIKHEIQDKEAILIIMRALDRVLISLEKIQGELETPLAASLEIELGGDIQIGENNMLQVASTGSVLATLVALDAAGNPGAKLDVAPVWSLSDETLGTVNAAEDGLTAVVVLSGKLGKFVLTAKAGELSDDSDEIEVVVGAAALLRVDLSAK